MTLLRESVFPLPRAHILFTIKCHLPRAWPVQAALDIINQGALDIISWLVTRPQNGWDAYKGRNGDKRRNGHKGRNRHLGL